LPGPSSTKVVDHLIGAMVAACRAEAGLSQKQLAAKTGISVADLKLHEAGTERIPASALMKVAQALGTPVSYFFGAIEIVDCTGLDGSRSASLGPADCVRVIEVFSQFHSPQAFEAAMSVARTIAVLEDSLRGGAVSSPDDDALPPQSQASS